MGIECRVIMTRMSAPIGNSVGNSLEILESINCLKGELNNSSYLQALVEIIGIYILSIYFLHDDNDKNYVFIQLIRWTFTRNDT